MAFDHEPTEKVNSQTHRPCCSPAAARETLTRSTAVARSAVTPATTTVRLNGGTFMMGSDDDRGHPADLEGPARPVVVEPFEIGVHTATNAEFAAFVAATGYVTDAERFGWSFVFAPFLASTDRTAIRGHAAGATWWVGVDGASWRRPFGPSSTCEGAEDHPVVHVSWRDASAYCTWSGTRLPTEAEWEYAARGGLEGKLYPWGDELRPGGKWQLNIWQGVFPTVNTEEDGFRATAPVSSYEPNGFGLYQTVGNVWEWTADPFESHAAQSSSPRAIRGGSYLCHPSYCNRYRVAARSSNTPDSSGGNLGFRYARDR